MNCQREADIVGKAHHTAPLASRKSTGSVRDHLRRRRGSNDDTLVAEPHRRHEAKKKSDYSHQRRRTRYQEFSQILQMRTAHMMRCGTKQTCVGPPLAREPMRGSPTSTTRSQYRKRKTMNGCEMRKRTWDHETSKND